MGERITNDVTYCQKCFRRDLDWVVQSWESGKPQWLTMKNLCVRCAVPFLRDKYPSNAHRVANMLRSVVDRWKRMKPLHDKARELTASTGVEHCVIANGVEYHVGRRDVAKARGRNIEREN